MDFISEKLTEYISKNSNIEPEILARLNQETHQKILKPRMLSGHIQGRFLSMLSKMKSPSTILEIGTYTGYGTLCLLEGLKEDGKIFTIDRNEELLKIQNKYFEESGERDKIIQLTGNAKEILNDLNETYDLVFIDADKENYKNYFNHSLDLIDKDGLIVIDNVLWHGEVVDNNKQDKLTVSIREFNSYVNENKRVENLIIPLGDGLTVCRKL